MYSAYDGVHGFSVPAKVIEAVTDVKWSVEPSDAADLAPDWSGGGTLIKPRRAGDFKIFASAGQRVGVSDLHVTAATPAQWALGEARYHNDVEIAPATPADAGVQSGPPMTQFPDDAACDNCHGANAKRLKIEHTPQQTGGYSDSDLIQIFTTGNKPQGAPFSSMIPPFFFRMFHTWSTATPEEAQGLVVYLRSLEPKTQGEILYDTPPSP